MGQEGRVNRLKIRVGGKSGGAWSMIYGQGLGFLSSQDKASNSRSQVIRIRAHSALDKIFPTRKSGPSGPL